MYCPHACGGVPTHGIKIKDDAALSPRMWGCTGIKNVPYCPICIVPTHVGVYRYHWPFSHFNYHCPHACGGVPKFNEFAKQAIKLSPRMWGCTECK